MIGFLRGKLLDKQPPILLLDVQGVGYEVAASMTTFYELPEIGADVALYTQLVVREDAHTLYGFLHPSERLLFRGLLRVNGVGAKLALTILSGMDVDTFTACVQNQDTAMLTRMPGVGKKTAERLVVELRDRIDDWSAKVAVIPGAGRVRSAGPANAAGEAVSALVALGYKPHEASRMVRAIDGADLAAEEIIRRALQDAVR